MELQRVERKLVVVPRRWFIGACIQAKSSITGRMPSGDMGVVGGEELRILYVGESGGEEDCLFVEPSREAEQCSCIGARMRQGGEVGADRECAQSGRSALNVAAGGNAWIRGREILGCRHRVLRLWACLPIQQPAMAGSS